MKTYVVQPNYIVNDALDKLQAKALKTWRENTDATLIVVDDGSPRGYICDADVFLRNESNQGFAKTCNRGFRWIFENEPDDCYIVCANNDIEINKKVLPALQEPFSRFENVAITGIVSTMEHDMDGVPLDEFSWGHISEGGLLRDRMQDGGLWMSKKSILQKIGIFDEQFERGGYEDVDIFLRARDTFGMKIVMSGMACYWHKQGATRWGIDEGGFNIESKGYENRNREKFAAKWGFDYYSGNVWKQIDLVT